MPSASFCKYRIINYIHFFTWYGVKHSYAWQHLPSRKVNILLTVHKSHNISMYLKAFHLTPDVTRGQILVNTNS